MSADDFSLTNLPADARKKLKALALEMGYSEEQLVAKILSVIFDQCDDPNNQNLVEFVKKAKQALKKDPV